MNLKSKRILSSLISDRSSNSLRGLQLVNSTDLAKYIEATNGISKPWLLVLLRLKKLEERKDSIPPEEYMEEMTELHQDMMNLGEWWVGIEDEVFGK
jgi:hypothetical protein